MLVRADDFINEGENAITINFDGDDVLAVWSEPTLLGRSGQLFTAITVHIDSALSALSPDGKVIIKDSVSYSVESSRLVLRGALWKLVLSDDS